MDGNKGPGAATCPMMHGKPTAARFTTRSNRDWWPNSLNLRILSQHQRLDCYLEIACLTQAVEQAGLELAAIAADAITDAVGKMSETLAGAGMEEGALAEALASITTASTGCAGSEPRWAG